MKSSIWQVILAALITVVVVLGTFFGLLSLQGCASLHLGVKAKHSSDNTASTKTVAASAFDSVVAVNQNINSQMQQLLLVSTHRNVATNITDEDAALTLHGSRNSSGHTGNGKISISQGVSIGRVQASGTYYYDKDSIHVSLHIGDTIINIHRHIATTTDLSKISSFKATTNTSSNVTASTATVHIDSSLLKDAKVHNKQTSSVEVNASASIGGKGYLLAFIALCIGLLIGKYVFGSKHRQANPLIK